jgi:hypothetical protein
MATFKSIIKESSKKPLSTTEQHMEMYKEIKKKKGYKASFLDKDFKVTDSFKMNLSDGSKVKVLLNTKDYDKPVYWFEWL